MTLGPAMAQGEIDNTPQGGAAPNDVSSKRPGLISQWTDWLSKPENNAALLEFGLNAMQPYGAGQTAGGHIARSIGAGMEARDRVIADENAQEQQAQVNARANAESGRQDKTLSIAEQRLALDKASAGSDAELKSAQADYYRTGGRGSSKRTPVQEASDLLNTAAKAHKAVMDDLDASPEMQEDARAALDLAYKRFAEVSGSDVGANPAPAPASGGPVVSITGDPKTDAIIAEAKLRIAEQRRTNPRAVPTSKQRVIELIRRTKPNYNGEGLE